MNTLFVIARQPVVDSVVRQALKAWRVAERPTIVAMTDNDRLRSLLDIIGCDDVDLSNMCFAVDGTDESNWADFNAFLAALRMYEKLNMRVPAVVRSVNCCVR